MKVKRSFYGKSSTILFEDEQNTELCATLPAYEGSPSVLKFYIRATGYANKIALTKENAQTLVDELQKQIDKMP